jgi:hypothetical protein
MINQAVHRRTAFLNVLSIKLFKMPGFWKTVFKDGPRTIDRRRETFKEEKRQKRQMNV